MSHGQLDLIRQCLNEEFFKSIKEDFFKSKPDVSLKKPIESNSEIANQQRIAELEAQKQEYERKCFNQMANESAYLKERIQIADKEKVADKECLQQFCIELIRTLK